MSDLSENVNTRFGNGANTNPFFKTIVEILEDGGLYNNNLSASIDELNTMNAQQKEQVYSFTNLNGIKQCVSIDVLIDAISRGLMKKLQSPNGLIDTSNPSIQCSDAASNLSYKATLDESTTYHPNISLNLCTNIHQAISVLAQEISKLKSAAGITTAIGIPPSSIDKVVILEDNR